MIEIHGHRLPELLQKLIHTERWKKLPDHERFQNLFPDPVDFGFGKFCSPELMKRESDRNAIFWGFKNTRLREDIEDGTVDPAELVLIGDTRQDAPFALDYSRSPANPAVLFLAQGGWVEIAHDFEAFARRADLIGQDNIQQGDPTDDPSDSR